jgi:pimeloyl-ACP methyl ester carboxylesterase
MTLVYFAHGKESVPWGSKLLALASVAQERGCRLESPDYSAIADPDQRVQLLLELCPRQAENLVLVGSSMGGYVSTVASEVLKPAGLFLMAPAFYLPGYANQEPTPFASIVAIVHGWQDELIPPQHSLRFAEKHKAELYLVNGGHRLLENIPFLQIVFGYFLERVQALDYETD